MNLSTVTTFKNIHMKDGMLEVKGEKLEALQSVLKGMLADIHRVCEKHKIPYFLSGGSMLGAVRHHGFIPWDDDMDIFMTRDAFDCFREIFPGELGEGYWLHTPRDTHDYGMTISRVRKKGTVVRGREDAGQTQCGAWVDIFVLENTYDNKFLRGLHGFLSMACGFALSCRMFYSRRDLYLYLVSDEEEQIKTFKTKIRLGRLLSFLSLDTWTRLTDAVYSMCHDNDSVYVVCPSGRKHFTGEQYPRDPFCKTMECRFEEQSTYISAWSDGYMKMLYGDYMKIPRESERETHVVLEFDLGTKAD